MLLTSLIGIITTVSANKGTKLGIVSLKYKKVSIADDVVLAKII